jgi:CubicO group peptidase (beta-lactamase class C family)
MKSQKLKLILSGVVLISLMSCNNSSNKEQSIDETSLSEKQINTLSNKLFSDIDTLLMKYNTPGVCITIIDSSKAVYTKGFGSRSNKEELPINSQTLFQSASIGKSITAYTVMELVQDGLLNLDEDVNKILKTWKLPENIYTKTEKVTLRRLLSHTAGINVHGFDGYKLGESLPTINQVLNGEPPANNDAIKVANKPGENFNYSGGGYMIIQKVLEDKFNKSFESIVKNTIFKPLKMNSAFYSATFSENEKSNVAFAHNKNGEMEASGKWHNFVEFGTGAGLWVSSDDLAKFSIDIINTFNGKTNYILSQKTLKEMFQKPDVSDTDMRISADYYGLGFFVIGEGTEVFHGGSNDPGFEHILYLLPGKGKGVIIMTNGFHGDRLYQEIIGRIAKEFKWNE